MDRASRAASQWAQEIPDLETGPMTLLGRLGEAAWLFLVIASIHCLPLLICNRGNLMSWQHSDETVTVAIE